MLYFGLGDFVALFNSVYSFQASLGTPASVGTPASLDTPASLGTPANSPTYLTVFLNPFHIYSAIVKFPSNFLPFSPTATLWAK